MNKFQILDEGLFIRKISKSIGNKPIIRDISLNLKKGEIVGLLGPNGAGKTTTFYIIVCLIKPDTGSIYIDKRDVSNLPIYLRAQNGISYLPQEASIFRKLTVENNLLAILQTLKISKRERLKKLDQLINQMGLEKVSCSKGYQLSGGERRRVEIARALVISPSFLLLDEPFSGIDPKQVLELQKIISELRQSGIGILVTDHNVRETLSVTDWAYILNNGQVFRAGPPEELQSDSEVKRVYLGESFDFR